MYNHFDGGVNVRFRICVCEGGGYSFANKQIEYGEGPASKLSKYVGQYYCDTDTDDKSFAYESDVGVYDYRL